MSSVLARSLITEPGFPSLDAARQVSTLPAWSRIAKSASVWCLVLAGLNIRLQFLIGGSLQTAKLLMAAGTGGYILTDLIGQVKQLRRHDHVARPLTPGCVRNTRASPYGIAQV